MALFSVDFYSKSLFRPVNFKLFVPNDVPPEMKMGNTYYERPTKILVLLHGYNGGNLDWALYSNALRFLQIQFGSHSALRRE